MITILDYKIGNVRSVQKAVERAIHDSGSRQQVQLSADPRQVLASDGVILPGVGAFGACISNLKAAGLAPVVHDVVQAGIPLLGICVGMQMLFEGSEEMGQWQGLGLLPGWVRRALQARRWYRADWWFVAISSALVVGFLILLLRSGRAGRHPHHHRLRH